MLFPLSDGSIRAECQRDLWVPCLPSSHLRLKIEHCTGDPVTLPMGDDDEHVYNTSKPCPMPNDMGQIKKAVHLWKPRFQLDIEVQKINRGRGGAGRRGGGTRSRVFHRLSHPRISLSLLNLSVSAAGSVDFVSPSPRSGLSY